MKLSILVLLILLFSCEKPEDTGKIITTESGLKYMDHVIGEGDEAINGNYVALDYRGWTVKADSNLFTDWSEDDSKTADIFDESYKRGKPHGFFLGRGEVIKGWDEGVKGMKIGGKRTLIIPAEIGYGERGSGKIEPNATLKFTVELKRSSPEITIIEEGSGDKLKDGDKFLFRYKVYHENDTSKVILDRKDKLIYGDKKNYPLFINLMKDARVGAKRKALSKDRFQLNVVEFEVLKLAKKVEMWDLPNAKSTTTKSGLQYIIVKEGLGAKVLGDKKIKAHYSGFLGDGTMFDSSVEREEPLEFDINQVVKGWQEGMRLLNVGSKARFIIPPELAWGAKGGGPIPPNATVIFDVEVLDIIQ